MPVNRIDQLVEEWAPRLQKAFLAAVYSLRDRAQIGLIAEMLERGDLDGAFKAVGLEQALFREVDATFAQAFEAGGRYTAERLPAARQPDGQRLSVVFDVRNPTAEAWLRDYSASLVREITDGQRETIRAFLVAGMEAGTNPRTVALDLVGRINPSTGRREGGVIGLTASQDAWVRAYEQELRSLDPAALTRKLRDQRFDRVIAKAIDADRPLTADQVAKMVATYRNRALRYRAETIARTEAMTALHEAQHFAVRQAISAGQMPEGAVTKTWHSAGDDRVRHTHRVLNGQKVAFEGVFVSPSGARLRFPGDSKAPASERIGCRCWAETKVDFLAAAVEPPAPARPARQPAWWWNPTSRSGETTVRVVDGAEDFGLFKTEDEAQQLAAQLLAGTPKNVPMSARWIGDDEFLSFEAHGKGVVVEREFRRRNGQLVVEHSYFAIAPELQRGGHAAEMMRASLSAYDQLGVSRVEVHANLDVGGYAWARAGFAASRSMADQLVSDLSEAATLLSESRRRAAEKVLSTSSLRSMMYDLSQLRDADGAFGKELLLGSDWYGYLDLNDPLHRALLIEALAR